MSEDIVGSKKSGSSADGAIFQRELLRAGILVSPQKAGELLREVQSDSDEDFAAEMGSPQEREVYLRGVPFHRVEDLHVEEFVSEGSVAKFE